MPRILLIPTAALLLVGCGNSYPVRRIEQPVNVTHEVAFGDYRRVFNTTYHILNRYGVVQNSSYRYGEITALVGEDNHLFDKTRRTIQARIFDTGDFFDVECRVLIAVEDSEVATFPDQFQPRYSWKTIASDPFLETRLNNEIRAALSGGAWQAKQPLTPKASNEAPATAPDGAAPGARPAPTPGSSDDAEDEEVRVRPRARQSVARRDQPGAQDYARLGVASLQQGAFDRAEQAFLATLEADARDPFAHYLLAQALFSRGDYQGALRRVRLGGEENPDWVTSGLDVRTLYGEDDTTFAQRLVALESAAQDEASLWVLVGYMRLHGGDPAGAMKAFEHRAGARDPLAHRYEVRATALLAAQNKVESF